MEPVNARPSQRFRKIRWLTFPRGRKSRCFTRHTFARFLCKISIVSFRRGRKQCSREIANVDDFHPRCSVSFAFKCRFAMADRIEIKFNDTRRLRFLSLNRCPHKSWLIIREFINCFFFFVLGFVVPRKMKVEPNEVTNLVIQTRKFHAKTKPTLNVNCLQT